MTQDEFGGAALTLEGDWLFCREYTREHLANGQDIDALVAYLDSKDAK